ncbi:MAG: hypothetical protein N3A55_09245 [Methylohalobius sp.]|nr:hypothetical protein [Methylohalobius sp.]
MAGFCSAIFKAWLAVLLGWLAVQPLALASCHPIAAENSQSQAEAPFASSGLQQGLAAITAEVMDSSQPCSDCPSGCTSLVGSCHACCAMVPPGGVATSPAPSAVRYLVEHFSFALGICFPPLPKPPKLSA